MKDVIRHNRRFQLGTVAALVSPREIHTESRNSACRTGVSRNVHFILVRIAYWVRAHCRLSISHSQATAGRCNSIAESPSRVLGLVLSLILC